MKWSIHTDVIDGDNGSFICLTELAVYDLQDLNTVIVKILYNIVYDMSS